MQNMYQIIIALVFHLLDLITGLIGAVKQGNIHSAKMRDGMFKKFGFVFCYILAYIIDTFGSEIGLQIGVAVLPIIVLYAVTTEIVSILENISVINPDLLPEKLMKLFHIKNDEKKGEE